MIDGKETHGFASFTSSNKKRIQEVKNYNRLTFLFKTEDRIATRRTKGVFQRNLFFSFLKLYPQVIAVNMIVFNSNNEMSKISATSRVF